MACELESIPQSCDVAIANAMAIAIAMSNPQVYSIFRDSFSIINDLSDEAYGRNQLARRNSRQKLLYQIPNLMNLQLGLSLRILRVYLGRTYCVLFIQSRKESNRCNFGDTYLYPYLMKVLGDSSNVGYEYISLIEKNICDFLSRERLLLASRSKDVSSGIASVIIIPPPFSDVIAEPHTPTVESEKKCIHNNTRLTNKVKKLRYTIKKMRQTDKYAKKVNSNKNTSPIKEKTIGMKIVELIRDEKTYTKLINGRICLSITTGILVHDLISNCGCSLEKMPAIIEIVLRMLFGNIDKKSVSTIVKCPTTYSLASERSAVLVRIQTSNKFLIRGNDSPILNSYLIMDATKKGSKSLVAKLYTYVCKDGIVRLGSFQVDNTGNNN